MVTFFKRNRSCRMLLVEKTDRLYRNQRDAVTLEDLDIQIHFIKEGEILAKNSTSQVKFMHDIRLAMARNYSENLREEVKKGMCEKASQGTYPGRPPFGYRNNKAERTIEIHPEKAVIARRVFELYVSGRYSLLALSKAVRQDTGTYISKTNLHKMLTNPFYIGRFEFNGNTYEGTHKSIISHELYAHVQSVLSGHNRPHYSKHEIAFRGLLTCAHDDCAVTGEIKKGKYVYYHCTGFRGKCALPRFREEEISERLGHVLRDVHIPAEVVRSIEASLQQAQKKMRDNASKERARLERELASLHNRMDAAYLTNLTAKSQRNFGNANRLTGRRKNSGLRGCSGGRRRQNWRPIARRAKDFRTRGKGLFSVPYAKTSRTGRAAQKVLLNCTLDGVSLYPTYRKPFDMIAKRAKFKEWSGREDFEPPTPWSRKRKRI